MKTMIKEYLKYDPLPPSILYHYCGVQTLLSIIENCCIWLSDASKTNDKTETHWLFSLITDVIDEAILSYKKKFDEELLQKAKFYSYAIVDNLKSKRAPIVQTTKSYLACFSENADLLSQWRAYGNDGHGVSVGFNSESFLMFRNGNEYEFSKVIYDKEKTELFLHNAIDQPPKYCILNHLQNSDKERSLQNLSLQIALLINSIYQEGFLFKNSNFFEEKEWRLFRVTNNSNFNNSDGVDDYGYAEFLERIFADNTKYVGQFTRSQIKFRSTDSDLRSYMELGFERCKKNIIKEIVLGPKCLLDPFDLKLLLAKNGFIDDVSSDQILIGHSSIPYV